MVLWLDAACVRTGGRSQLDALEGLVYTQAIPAPQVTQYILQAECIVRKNYVYAHEAQREIQTEH